MTIHDELRRQIASRVVVRDTEELTTLAVRWWSAIATQLIPLVGQDGFNILYSRSVSLAQTRFAWLAPQLPDLSFTSLRACFATRGSDEALDACKELLFVFADLLAGLIGESLTASIFNAAWGGDALRIGEKGNNHE